MRRANITQLRRLESYPSISLLMPTHRAHPANQQDPIRFRNLLEEARKRLETEVGKRPSWPIVERMDTLAGEIEWQSNEDGLALFASQEFGAWYRLPFPVEARVAIDRTFETREILYALHRMPRYRVLALSENATRLLEGTGTDLEEVRDEGFPLAWRGPGGVTRRPDGAMMQSSNVREAHLKEFFAEVRDRFLESTRNDPLPLVLAGTTTALSMFERLDADSVTVAATIEGSYADTPPAGVGGLAWPVLQEWLNQQKQSVIGEVSSALGARRLASGLDDAWKTAREGRGAKLVVEEAYRQPAILKRDGWELEPVDAGTSSAGPSHVDDAVDELIELVIDRGGEVAFVDEGALAGHGRVALILRF